MFLDRTDAGRQLAKKLKKYASQSTVVLALPRGGVVLGYEVARAIKAPLDLTIARKIGHPNNPEYAIGAVTERGEPVLNSTEVADVDRAWLDAEIKAQRAEAKRRRQIYLGTNYRSQMRDKTVIVVDDGVATGLTMQAALIELRADKVKKLVVAVPVLPTDMARKLRTQADELIALSVPEHYMGSVGAYYRDFRQVTDDEVVDYLARANYNRENNKAIK